MTRSWKQWNGADIKQINVLSTYLTHDQLRIDKPVPEKLKNIDNPYIPKKAIPFLIEKYEKGEGFAQKFQLAFPAIFEVPQIDLLVPVPGGTGSLGSGPILSNWFKILFFRLNWSYILFFRLN